MSFYVVNLISTHIESNYYNELKDTGIIRLNNESISKINRMINLSGFPHDFVAENLKEHLIKKYKLTNLVIIKNSTDHKINTLILKR